MLGVGGIETVDRLIKQAEARNLNNIDAAKMKSGMHNLIENLENQKKALSSRLSKRQIKNTMYYNGLSNGPLEGINNKIKVIKRISYGYKSFSNFKAKILLVFSLFTPSETNKKPRYSKEERQAVLAKKKEIRLKRKNRKKAILLNIA